MILTESDKVFLRTFLAVLGILVLITVGVAIAANSIHNPMDEAEETDERLVGLEDARIAPVGSVNTGEPIIAAATPAAAPAANAEPRSGDAVYNVACMACHATGAAGAPKVGDKAAWASRTGKGVEALIASAINGIGAMPAKGGNPTISDAEVKAAVEYMMKETGL